MAKPNYGFEKRQKELAKQQKRALKAEKKANRASEAPSPESEESLVDPVPPQEP